MHAQSIMFSTPRDFRPTVSARSGRVIVTTLFAACLLITAGLCALGTSSRDPVSSVKTPNPAKAPWYLLSVAEAIVYSDPYYAGVLSKLPTPIQYVLVMPVLFVMPIAFASFVAVVFAYVVGARRQTKSELITEIK
jgi:hypothetical protein